MQRYFLTDVDPNTQTAQLPSPIAHHLMKVLRAGVGTKVEVVLADHNVYSATVKSVDPPTIAISKKLNLLSELPVDVTIACGLPKTNTKLDWIVQKGTELGAKRIVFFAAARSISHWVPRKQIKKIQHLQKIANGAAEQSHRNFQPQVQYCSSLEHLLTNYPADLRLVAWEESAKQGERTALVKTVQHLQAGNSLLGIFGPEGGLSQAEISVMEADHVKVVGLGPRILRTETAPLYFLAAVSTLTELMVFSRGNK